MPKEVTVLRKKILSLFLAAALALSLCAAPLAAESHMSNFKKCNTYSAYSDIWSGAWYGSAAKLCYEYGLMHGTYGKFNPRNTVSVAEALAIADRIYEIYTTGESTLKGGSGADWYQPYVDYAVKNGIISESAFTDYTRPATRAEIAYIFADALPPAELHAINDIDHLTDVPMGKYYYSVLLLYNAGVLTGSGTDCLFRPNDTITRAEIASIAARMIVPKERKKFILLDKQEMNDVIFGLTVYMPGEREERDAGAAIAYAAKRYRCEVLTENDGAVDITAYTKGEAKQRLADQLSAVGFTMNIPSVSATEVSFGTVPAYRYQFKAVGGDGKERLCFGYTFIKAGMFCSVTFLTGRDSTEFRTAIDALTLDGASHT